MSRYRYGLDVHPDKLNLYIDKRTNNQTDRQAKYYIYRWVAPVHLPWKVLTMFQHKFRKKRNVKALKFIN